MKPAADFCIPQDAFPQLFWLVCAVFPQTVVFYVHHVNIRPDGRKPLVPVSILIRGLREFQQVGGVEYQPQVGRVIHHPDCLKRGLQVRKRMPVHGFDCQLHVNALRLLHNPHKAVHHVRTPGSPFLPAQTWICCLGSHHAGSHFLCVKQAVFQSLHRILPYTAVGIAQVHVASHHRNLHPVLLKCPSDSLNVGQPDILIAVNLLKYLGKRQLGPIIAFFTQQGCQPFYTVFTVIVCAYAYFHLVSLSVCIDVCLY